MGDLSKFDDSFNMIVGTTNKDIDLFDNNYISINVYDLDHKWKPKISENVKLRLCTYEDKAKFISD